MSCNDCKHWTDPVKAEAICRCDGGPNCNGITTEHDGCLCHEYAKPKYQEPRYDDVFYKGLEWLASLD